MFDWIRGNDKLLEELKRRQSIIDKYGIVKPSSASALFYEEEFEYLSLQSVTEEQRYEVGAPEVLSITKLSTSAYYKITHTNGSVTLVNSKLVPIINTKLKSKEEVKEDE